MMRESFEAELLATSVLDTLRRDDDVSARNLDLTSASLEATRCREPRALRRSFVGGVVLSAMLTSMGACAAPSETEIARIVAFGDSTTATAADWTSEITEVYAQCLPRTLAAHGIRAEVINAGIGNTTTHDGKLRFDRDVRGHTPQLVVIQFGINDSWIDADLGRTEPRLTREEFRDNLRYFIRTLREDGAGTILMTPNPMRWSDPVYIELFSSKPGLLDTGQERGINALLDLYAQDVRDVASEQGTPLVDVFAAFEDYGKQPGKSIDELLLAGDGIHPNDAGQRLVCELLTPGIAAALTRKER